MNPLRPLRREDVDEIIAHLRTIIHLLETIYYGMKRGGEEAMMIKPKRKYTRRAK